MKLQELKDVKHAIRLPIMSCTELLRWERYHDADEQTELVWKLATAVTVEADLEDHLSALEEILDICAAVAKGRYLEDWQRCHWEHDRCEHACMSQEHCDGFDERDPHTAILAWLDDLRPFRANVRAWIEAQLPLHRGMREMLWGEQGIFGGSHQVFSLDQGRVLTADETAAWQAEHDAKEDRANESVALRIDQYALNVEHIRQICQARGDLQAVVSIITEGLPPQLRQPVSSS